jgi:DnaJ homolog subfamily C member 19
VPLGFVLLGIVILYFVVYGSPRLSRAAKAKAYHVTLGLGAILLLLFLLRVGAVWPALVGMGVWALIRLVMSPWLARRKESSQSATDGPRSKRGNTAASRPFEMTRRQALEVLGLQEQATKDEVVRAYRELMKRVHPDRGGSARLAAEVNRAREVLLAAHDNQ